MPGKASHRSRLCVTLAIREMIGSVSRYAPELSGEMSCFPKAHSGYSDQHFTALTID
jgi:hypothetical protein